MFISKSPDSETRYSYANDRYSPLKKFGYRVLPDCIVISHRGDLNMDHRIIHDASLVALRPIHHRCSVILAYETLSEIEWGMGFGVFELRFYFDITSTLELKTRLGNPCGFYRGICTNSNN